MSKRFVLTSQQVAKKICDAFELWAWYEEIHNDLVQDWDGFSSAANRWGTAHALQLANNIAVARYGGLDHPSTQANPTPGSDE